jgi:hypothetical protein
LLIGQGYYKLEPLAYLIDNPATISIIGTTSAINGKLEVNIIPVDQNGDPDISEDLLPESPMDLSNYHLYNILICSWLKS